MSKELTKAAQQALREVHMLILPVPAPEVSTLDLAKAVSERATKIAMLLTAALTQRPVAQTEREAWQLINPQGQVVAVERTAIKALARIDGYKPTVEGLLGYEEAGWRVVPASLPAPQQATPEPRLFIGACITDGRLHATVQRLESNGNVTLVATAEMDAASLHGRDCMAQMTPATPEPGLLKTFLAEADRAGITHLPATFAADLAAATPEPVEGRCRFVGEKLWGACSVAHVDDVLANPTAYPGYEARYLYDRPAPGVPEADPLQGAVDWFWQAIPNLKAHDVANRLSIGCNRAARLLAAAQAKGADK